VITTPKAPGTEGSRHVEHCMGTVFSIDIRDPGDWAEPLAEIVDWLHLVDRTFSTYRPGSDISRLQRGELDLIDADPLVRQVLDLCDQMEDATDGYFSAWWGGATDPTGLVKGWAIERASGMLRRRGSSNHAINGGGDVQTSGTASPGHPWRIGIADPSHRGRVLHVVEATDCAVATSGTAERGQHILDPHTGDVATHIVSATVICPSLTIADSYATAAVAMGSAARSWLERTPTVSAVLVDARGAVVHLPVSLVPSS
jgi:thiamine biosynthesis lipoprotein